MIKLKTWIKALSFLILFQMQAIATETGTAIKDDMLRIDPFSDAKSAATIKRGESLTILKKQGAWLQVKTNKSTGWLKLLAVKRNSTASTNASANVLNQTNGRAGTGQIVSTTGIRGLSDEELKAATFNETEVNLLESYTTSSLDAEKFAKAGQLKTVNFAPLTQAPQNTQTNSALPFGGAK